MRRVLWLGVFCIAGCSALSKPVMGPDGQPIKRADGSDQTVYDATVETGGGLVSLLTGNALLAPMIGSIGAAFRETVVGKKAT